MTTAVHPAWAAASSRAVIAARTRPSRWVAGSPAVWRGIVIGFPTGLPESWLSDWVEASVEELR
ncbi:MAG: hypothetical protein JWQ86_1065 [Mycobacterium sp.]|nr:hypothetical protein [Mycobacterium sp.]